MLATPRVATSSDWAPNVVPPVLPGHAAWVEATVWFLYPRPALRWAAKWRAAIAPPALVLQPVRLTSMAMARLTSLTSSACSQAGISQEQRTWTKAVWLISMTSSSCLASGATATAKATNRPMASRPKMLRTRPLTSGEGLFLGFMSNSETWRSPQHWYTFPFPCLREALGLVAQLVRAHP